MVLRLWHLLVVVGAVALLALGAIGGMVFSGHKEPRTKTVVQVLSVAAPPQNTQADDLAALDEAA
jgi:cell division septation protein DedD